jgi:branched-chain amino acid transport system substrate-binding protein
MKRIVNLMSVLSLVLLMFAGLSVSPAAGEEVIKVGAVQPLTGVFKFAGFHLNDGLQDSLMMANEAGGINGKKIEYIVEDGGYNLKKAKAAFIKIVEQHNPLVMYGESTALGQAMSGDIKNRFKILYGSTSFSSELAYAAMNPYAFVSGPTYGDQFGILLKYVAKVKPKAKVAFFYSDSAFGKDPIKYGRLMCRKLRLKLVAEEVARLGATDVTAQVQSLKEKDPDYVIFQGYVVSPVPEVIRQCRDLGMDCTFMGTFWGTTRMILSKLGPLADGYLGVSPYNFWWMDDVPMIRKIKAYNAANHPDVTYRPSFYMQGFATGLIFVECLKRADKARQLNGDGLVKALKSLKGFETGGLTAPLTINNNRFPVARVWKANADKGIFEPAPLRKGLQQWIRMGY